MGTGSFPGVKWPGRDADNPPPSSVEVIERVELYLCSTSGFLWPVRGGELSSGYCALSLLCFAFTVLCLYCAREAENSLREFTI
jgi:hypothetical protein